MTAQKILEMIPTVSHEDLVKKLAWEVAKNVIDHHKNVYSRIFADAPSTFPISLRNGIYNQIQSAIECHSDSQIRLWIARSEAHRKEMQRLKRLAARAKKAQGNKEETEQILRELAK